MQEWELAGRPRSFGRSRFASRAVDKVGFCHGEPVTDVTGVAIRIPEKPWLFGIFQENGSPRQCAQKVNCPEGAREAGLGRWLAMTRFLSFVYSLKRKNGNFQKKFPFLRILDVKRGLPSPLHNHPMRVFMLLRWFVYSLRGRGAAPPPFWAFRDNKPPVLPGELKSFSKSNLP